MNQVDRGIMEIAPCPRPKPECAPEVRKGFASFYVYCPRCKQSARTGDNPSEAIAIWNYWRELDKPKSPRSAQRSRCCKAPIFFVYEGGPLCTKCKKWTVTERETETNQDRVKE